MIKQHEAPTNGAPSAPNRLAMNRLGPQKGSTSAKPAAEPVGHSDDLGQNRLAAANVLLTINGQRRPWAQAGDRNPKTREILTDGRPFDRRPAGV